MRPACLSAPRDAKVQQSACATVFTLIELLVVVGVVVILIGILLPSLSKARAQAKLNVYKAHLRQLGAAILMYADQHDEVMPLGPACSGPFDFFCADVAINQLWIGEANEQHSVCPSALAPLSTMTHLIGSCTSAHRTTRTVWRRSCLASGPSSTPRAHTLTANWTNSHSSGCRGRSRGWVRIPWTT